jgi:hypothetical protein
LLTGWCAYSTVTTKLPKDNVCIFVVEPVELLLHLLQLVRRENGPAGVEGGLVRLASYIAGLYGPAETVELTVLAEPVERNGLAGI